MSIVYVAPKQKKWLFQSKHHFLLVLILNIPKGEQIFPQPSLFRKVDISTQGCWNHCSPCLTPKPALNRSWQQAVEGNSPFIASSAVIIVRWSPAPAAELLPIFCLFGSDFSFMWPSCWEDCSADRMKERLGQPHGKILSLTYQRSQHVTSPWLIVVGSKCLASSAWQVSRDFISRKC